MGLINNKKSVVFDSGDTGLLPKNTFENEYISIFDYNEIENNDKNELMRYEGAIKAKLKDVSNSLIEMGRYLNEAEKIFKKYNLENPDREPIRYREWYESFGLSTRSTSIARRAYEIYEKYGTQVNDFSGKMVEALTSKDLEHNPEYQKEIVEKISKGEIKSVKEIKELKNKLFNVDKPVLKMNSLRGVNCSENENIVMREVETNSQFKEDIIEIIPLEPEKTITFTNEEFTIILAILRKELDANNPLLIKFEEF